MGRVSAGPLHVLHVDTGRDWRGGQAQVLGLMQSLRGEPSLRQTLAAPPGSPLARAAAAAGLERFDLPLRGEWDLASPRLMRGFVRAEAVGLVHAHDAHAHTIAQRAVRRLGGVRLVVHRRVDFPVGQSVLSRRKYGPRVDRFVAISEAVAAVLRRCGIAGERITVIPSGVDPSKFDGLRTEPALRAELGLTLSQPVIGTVGALVDHKGHRYLIEAMPHVLREQPAACAVIVGEGELRPDLERQIDSLGLQGRVFLAGWRADVASCLDEFTLFCLPSHLEGLCTSLLDATLRDRPLVACAAGGVPEIVRDGETGWLVPVKDSPALAAALLDALRRPEEAKRRAMAARRQTVETFSLHAMAAKTLALWRDLTSAG